MPDLTIARQISQVVVEKNLAACVNIVPGLESVYRWQGEVQHDAEYLLIIKTTDLRFKSIEDEIIRIHPYQLPEIIALPVVAGNEKYLQWIRGDVHEA